MVHSVQRHQRLGCGPGSSCLPRPQPLPAVPSSPRPCGLLRVSASCRSPSHAPGLPGRPLPAAPPGRPCLRAGPRVQPEPCVRNRPGAAQAARCGECQAWGRRAASGPGAGVGVSRDPSGPGAGVWVSRDPSGPGAGVRVSGDPLSPRAAFSPSHRPRESSFLPLAGAGWGPLSSSLSPHAAPEASPCLGWGTRAVTSGHFFLGARGTLPALAQGGHLQADQGLRLPGTVKGPPKTCTDTGG